MPLVSVVLIFLNEERFIEQAVDSVRNQTLTDWELILVDDGSTDTSTVTARELATTDERIRYLEHPGHQNRGMSASRNLGVAHGTAPYVAFIDADDVWEPEKLAEQAQILESMPDVAMTLGAIRYWYSWDPTATEDDFALLPGGMANRCIDPPEAALRLFPLGKEPGGAVDLLVRRSAYDAVGGFEDRFRDVYEDQAFLIKVFLRYRIYISGQAWLRYRIHDASCIRHTGRIDFLRMKEKLLDWFEEDAARLGDPRVATAVRHARRALPYQRLYVRLSDLLPPEFRKRVKRALSARSSIMHPRMVRGRARTNNSHSR